MDNMSDLEAKLIQMKTECGVNYYLTGMAGGVRYQPVVRYNEMHCYIHREDIQAAVEYLKLKPVNSGANAVLMIPYHECVLDHSGIKNDFQVVSPVQIYLDCMALKGRGEELAYAVSSRDICK